MHLASVKYGDALEGARHRVVMGARANDFCHAAVTRVQTRYLRAMDAPLVLLRAWWEAARTDAAGDERICDAMVLSTATPSGAPSSRVVLCRGIDGRGLRFFTNYESRKGRELEANRRVALVFYWPGLDRQARCEGLAERLDAAESDAYFAARPRASQLGAWASAQSSVIAGRSELEASLEEVRARFGDEGDVPCPPAWGGFRIVPESVELWQGRPSRLHDRLRYTRTAQSHAEHAGTQWRVDRLSP